jgi:hypothetical protein
MTTLPPPTVTLDTVDSAPVLRPKWPAVTILSLGVAVALGSVMPWATIVTGFGTIDFAGTVGDGQLTIALGVLLGVLGAIALHDRSRPMAWAWALAAVAGIGSAGIGINAFVNITDAIDADDLVTAQVGVGLLLVIAASAAAVVMAVVGHSARGPQQ